MNEERKSAKERDRGGWRFGLLGLILFAFGVVIAPEGSIMQPVIIIVGLVLGAVGWMTWLAGVKRHDD
jgi:hypothetical protein